MNNSTINENIVKLKGIFKQRFDIDLEGCREDTLDKELLGYDINLQPRDLVYLFFDVEREFDIKIPQEDIVEGRFKTFNGIVNIVLNCIQPKEKEVV